MQWTVVAAALIACSDKGAGAVPVRAATHWCPSTASPDGLCTPIVTDPDFESVSRFAAGLCLRRAESEGTACTPARLVICAVTDEAEQNRVCFLRWDACRANAQRSERGPLRCIAYYDDQPLDWRASSM